MNLRAVLATLVPALLIACSGGNSGNQSSVATLSGSAPVQPTAADIGILFIGNSHTSINNVPGLVGAMVRAAKPDKTVATEGAFLATLVLFATITGGSPMNLPTLTGINVDADSQQKLRDIASETVQTIAPRSWCPADLP